MKQQIAWALRLRCPNCGEADQMASWLKVRQRCHHCGLLFERGEHDYFIGAYTINLIAAELIVVIALLIGMFATWPDVPWRGLMWTLVPVTIAAPFVMLPYARSLWLALDLVFRPPEPSDFAKD